MRKSKREDLKTSAKKKQPTEPSDSETETQGAVIDPEDGLFKAFQEMKDKLGPEEFIKRLLKYDNTPKRG
jgi:hypothetical protein